MMKLCILGVVGDWGFRAEEILAIIIVVNRTLMFVWKQ
ncbi:Protein of unknown function [Bacillus cytotoxicus]|uniref:Uncharacterized protein n=1 Tax=Bacillus cytotoxicus TaxID=580165 RepID=A0AAX2CKR1_9BACI|nr:Protein of unknown function [Bacillus cytotoxicus]SCN41592.1 Protein of unknown function [Bacillus cytotoxicus]